ncbi:MAG: hypothetical protein HQ511_13540 [Rhodospirillales bacterium]|nr:hypothetical protein [Rhodospirillales bacterium]
MTHNNELPEKGAQKCRLRPFNKRAAILAGGGLVLVAMGLAGFWYMVVSTVHAEVARTEDMSPVTHVVGGRRFDIPKAYILHREDWTSGPEVGLLGMQALLPDMSPYSLDNAHVFNAFHPKHVFAFISLMYVPDGALNLYNWLTSDIVGDCTELEAGFRVCPTPWDDTRFLTSADGSRKYEFECTDEFMKNPPYCTGAFPLVANVEVEVFLHPKHLEEAEQIVANLFRRVCGFYRPTPGVELEYDHCQDDEYFNPGAK